MPREESFLLPLKYVKVSRNTHTSIDVMLEKNVDEWMEIDKAWTGFTRLTILEEKPPDEYPLSGERLAGNQTTPKAG